MNSYAAEFAAATMRILERIATIMDSPEARVLLLRIEAKEAYNARMRQRARLERPRNRPRRR